LKIDIEIKTLKDYHNAGLYVPPYTNLRGMGLGGVAVGLGGGCSILGGGAGCSIFGGGCSMGLDCCSMGGGGASLGVVAFNSSCFSSFISSSYSVCVFLFLIFSFKFSSISLCCSSFSNFFNNAFLRLFSNAFSLPFAS